MNSNSEWIAMSERQPTEADLPILLWNKEVPKAKYCANESALRCQLGLTCFSHWMPSPQPPPSEPTPEQRDVAAWSTFNGWHHGASHPGETYFYAGRRTQREEIAELVKWYKNCAGEPYLRLDHKDWQALRCAVGLGGET